MIKLAEPNEPVTDDAVLFGEHQNLVGVWNAGSAPQAKRPSCRSTAVIILTAGMVHHSGPFRLHVQIAKQLQRIGVASLRFDLSGIGESLAVGASGSSLDRASQEVGQAIDWVMENHDIDRVILFGLCSGADDAIHTAVHDPRVEGVIAMDGCGYRTPGFYFHRIQQHYLPRMLRFNKWSRLFRRSLRKDQSEVQSLKFGDDVREFPERQVAEEQLHALARRQVQLHFIYTGGVGDYYNHRGQFHAMFPLLKACKEITHQYFGDVDHVGFLCEDREMIVRHIGQTVQSMVH
jgi:pimeloyl-ACP methyl ester carboxylesterase